MKINYSDEQVLKETIIMTNDTKKTADIDSYELNIIKDVIKKYSEIINLVGEVQFTPESYGINSERMTYGKMLFKEADVNQLKEFDRTILSVLLYFYIKDNRYDKFVEQQSGNNKLSREMFNEMRNFVLSNFDTTEKENLLLYYVVINDLGKSQKMIDILKNKEIETVNHDLVLNYLLQYNMLPSLNNFGEENRQNLINVLNNGINFGQFIQGECVDYSFNKLQNLSSFEKILMLTEAMLDIGGVLGHINNQNGSAILNQSTVDNFMTASKILSTSMESIKIFNEFLIQKANKMQIGVENPDVRKTITRLCLMMRLSNQNDIKIVKDEILSNLEQYRTLIYEFNQSGYDNQPAILLYYSPALLNNAYGYFKKNNSQKSIVDTLNYCLPFMQTIMQETRTNMNSSENGVITVMLRDAAMVASEEPSQLYSFEVRVLSKDEASIQKKLKR